MRHVFYDLLDSNDSESHQHQVPSTTKYSSIWSQIAGEELNSNVVEFLNNIMKAEHPESQIHPNNQMYDNKKVAKDAFEVFQKYSCKENNLKEMNV